MPKMKPHRSAKKNIKVTSTGKLMRLRAGRKSGAAFASAPTTGSRKKHNSLQGEVEVSPADRKRMNRLLGR
ncbi:MAG: large subunit ribosomal protein [Frankiaceae bacterium]|jgi:large subunit ribosomal protein L35|nr:large subunit ribosomal protein [Frankiaceae bacterium]